MAKDAVMNLRLSKSDLALIDSAADIEGKARSAFLLECARKRAIDVLLDQRLFSLSFTRKWSSGHGLRVVKAISNA